MLVAWWGDLTAAVGGVAVLAQGHGLTAAVLAECNASQVAEACGDQTCFGEARMLHLTIQCIGKGQGVATVASHEQLVEAEAGEWSVDDVGRFLQSRQLDECAAACKQAKVNGAVLLSMAVRQPSCCCCCCCCWDRHRTGPSDAGGAGATQDDDSRTIGISLGHRITLQKVIDKLSKAGAVAAAQTGQPERIKGEDGGEAGWDLDWRAALEAALQATPLEPDIKRAIRALAGAGVNVATLVYVIDHKRDEMAQLRSMPDMADYSVDMALAIYVYTLDSPSLYRVINAAIYAPGRKRGRDGLSVKLRACLPYIKLLDAALVLLPARLRFAGECYRGVKWVFPSPGHHDPARHFPSGSTFAWYEFKSASRDVEVMYHDRFCGMAGPRTIFTIQATEAYSIDQLSHFGAKEAEVLFRPMTVCKVNQAVKQCKVAGADHSGFPDQVLVKQARK